MRLEMNQMLVVALLAVCMPAFADQQDSWNLVAGGTLLDDSNLFRRSAGNEKSDQVTVINAGVRVNKAYSLQRFVVDASVSDYRYRDNSHFDYLGKNLSAAWLWSLTPQLHGNLSKGYSEALNSFVDYTLTSKNIRTINTERFDLEWDVLGRFHLIGGVNHTEQKNSQAILADADYTADAAEYGFKYVLPSGSQMSLLGRNTNGEYKNRTINPFSQFDSGFSQRDTEFKFVWMLTDKSRFSGRVARINREHDHFASRDYKGTVGALDYTLDLTSKIRLMAGGKKDLVNYQTNLINYYQVNSYYFSPMWQISSKVALRARYNHETRDYRNTAQSAFNDTLRQSSASLEWSPLRTVTLSATVQRDTRESTQAGRDFTSNMVNFSANVVF